MAGDRIPVIYEFQVKGAEKLAAAFRNVEGAMNNSASTGGRKRMSEEQRRIKVMQAEQRRIMDSGYKQEERLDSISQLKKIKEMEDRVKAQVNAEARAAKAKEKADADAAKKARRESERQHKLELRQIDEQKRARKNILMAGVKGFAGGVADAVGTGLRIGGAAVMGGVASTAWRNVSQQQLAYSIVGNASSEKGKSLVDKAAKGEALRRKAQEIQAATGADANAVLAGARKFTEYTGDVDQSAALMDAFGSLILTNGDEHVDAIGTMAGVLYNNMGFKGEALKSALGMIRNQGKAGAFEIDEYARYLGPYLGLLKQNGGTTDDAMETLGDIGAVAQSVKGAMGNGAQTATAMNNMAVYAIQNRKDLNAKGIQTHEKNGNRVRLSWLAAQAATKLTDEEFKEYFGMRGMKGLTDMGGKVLQMRREGKYKGMSKEAVDKDIQDRLMQEFSKFQPNLEKEYDENGGWKYKENQWTETKDDAALMGMTSEASLKKAQGSADLKLGNNMLTAVDSFGKWVTTLINGKPGTALNGAIGWAAENPGTAVTAGVLGSGVIAGAGAMLGAAGSSAAAGGIMAGLGGAGLGGALAASVAATGGLAIPVLLGALAVGGVAWAGYNLLSGDDPVEQQNQQAVPANQQLTPGAPSSVPVPYGMKPDDVPQAPQQVNPVKAVTDFTQALDGATKKLNGVQTPRGSGTTNPTDQK